MSHYGFPVKNDNLRRDLKMSHRHDFEMTSIKSTEEDDFIKLQKKYSVLKVSTF